MAEIIELIAPDILKQGEQFIKMMETVATKHVELAKVYDMISDKTRVQIKEEQELEKLNKLKLQTDARVIKNEQYLTKQIEQITKKQKNKIHLTDDQILRFYRAILSTDEG